MRTALAWTTVVIFLACQQKQSAPDQDGADEQPARAEPKAKATPVEPEPAKVREHMEEHFSYALALKTAVIDGDREAVEEHARWIATHRKPEDFPEPWRPYVQNMRDAAKRTADADRIGTAARLVGQVGGACGACHEALDEGPRLEVGEPPKVDRKKRASDMKLHQWGADRMWEGLIGPSDVAWRKGAAALGEAPYCKSSVRDNQIIPDRVKPLVDHLYELGKRARAAEDPEARGRLYGELVSTCATCHRSGC